MTRSRRASASTTTRGTRWPSIAGSQYWLRGTGRKKRSIGPGLTPRRLSGTGACSSITQVRWMFGSRRKIATITCYIILYCTVP
jgi:hypothetical protein